MERLDLSVELGDLLLPVGHVLPEPADHPLQPGDLDAAFLQLGVQLFDPILRPLDGGLEGGDAREHGVVERPRLFGLAPFG